MRWLALCALWLGTGVAHAADPRPLTYREALQAALEGNPALRRATLDRSSAAAALLSARGIFDPELGADGTWRQSKSRGFFQGFPFESESRSWDLGANVGGSTATGTRYALNTSLDRNFSSFVTNFGAVGANEQIQDAYTANVNVSVTQQLLRGLRLSWNLQNVTRSRQGLRTAELALEAARQDALGQTANAYWAWAYREQLREIALQSEQIAVEALRIGTLRVEAGDLAPVERTRLEAAMVQAQANAMDARESAQQAADDLLLLIGGRPGEVIAPATPPGDASPIELDADAAIAVALAQNYDLAIARADLESAELNLTNARHGRLPTLSATGATGIGAQDDGVGGAITGLLDEDAFPFVQIGGSFRMPIGNRAARGETDSAAVAVEQRRNAVEDLEGALGAQVRQQVRVLESARRRVELADANVRLAEQTLSAEEALVDAGRSIQRDVLEARTELDRTRVEAARARTDHRLAQVALLVLQGQLTEDL
jgi:outer membrane protein